MIDNLIQVIRKGTPMSNKPAGAGKSSIDLVDWPKTAALLKILPDSEFLDLACGFGRYSLALADIIGPQGSIYAIDLWEDGLSQLRDQAAARHIDHIQIIHGDIRNELPIASGVIDNCLLATAFHDVPEADRGAVLDQVFRVLKPGGLLNVIEFRKDLEGPPGPPSRIRISAEDVAGLAEPLGLARTLVADIGPCVYLAQFVKN